MSSSETAAKVTPIEVGHNQLANAIRALSMDAVQAANSGHPGMPMGMADVATVLFTQYLKFDPLVPDWPDRDRFVLSAGHGSMLLYSLLHLTGYPEMTIDQIRNFRQLGSICAGHPEHGVTPGIEMTTGPLGQGIATAVGMALSERMLAAEFGDDLVDHYTYAIAGDGCLMEGVGMEAMSIAGHLKLNKLIVLFDDNHITIDGPTNISISDDNFSRFAACGWEVRPVDGHDPVAISAAIGAARLSDKPSVIACRTTIGFGAPNKQGTSAVHGAALGEEEVAATRENIGWPYAPFEIPDAILSVWRKAGERNRPKLAEWLSRMEQTSDRKKVEFTRRQDGELPADFGSAFQDYKQQLADDAPKVATRKASQMALEVINKWTPETIGGSADLAGSNNTKTSAMRTVTGDDYNGRFINYGVREHAMAAAMNGIALHGGFIPYSGTFLVFSDYCRGAMRLSALMEQRVIYVLTHDSIGLGEDGPTHQPVEHLASLRAIPNMMVFRPADAMETAECWEAALESKHTPSVMALTRQALPAQRFQVAKQNLSARGAYELLPAHGPAQITLIATGSEVSLAVEARDILQQEDIGARVISMPCWELFEQQDQAYRDEVLGGDTPRIAVEAGIRQGWDRYIGQSGEFIGMPGFGASAPADDLYKHFGITVEAIVEQAKSLLAIQ